MKRFFFILLLLIPFLATATERPIIDLRRYEKRIFSQNGEDGVLQELFSLLGTPSKYYVEFGAANGRECNTRYLRSDCGWKGLLMDGGYENLKINLHKEFITAENINELFEKYQVPHEFDLLSIDIDFNDFYVWHTIDSSYQPRIVIIEYNATHLPHEDKIVLYNPSQVWDNTNYFGASIKALYELGRLKGYSLVYADNCGVNLFFVRNDLLESTQVTFKDVNCVEKIYRRPAYGRGPNGGHLQDHSRRPYITSAEAMKRRSS